MKKKIHKKLFLNKLRIASLNPEELKNIWGATWVNACTDSCSMVKVCCPDTVETMANDLEVDIFGN